MPSIWTSPPVLALVLATLLAAHAPITSADAAFSLGGTSWQLVKFESGGDDTTLTPANKTQYTIAFDPDGKVSVRIDCNRGRGVWRSDGPGQLHFGALALTRAMCPAAPLSTRMPEDWESVQAYALKEGHLFLSLTADAGTYEFEPVGQTPGATAYAANIPNLPATFVGTLPCADCPGIGYQVNLFSDHTFASRMTYEERATSFDERGHWELSADGKTLTLHAAHGAPEKFSFKNADTLSKLDVNGREIQTTPNLNYDLKRATTFTPLPMAATASLENTYWRLTSLGEGPVGASNQSQEPHFVLNSETHRVSGSGGCNRLTGTYALRGDNLTFRQVAGTMMACLEGMQTERDFLQVLPQVSKWKITGQRLELYDARAKRVATFEARHTK